MTYLSEQGFSLTYLVRFDVKDEDAGLIEPSGLALSHGRNALWTVSDDTTAIFKLHLDGDLNKDESFEVPDNGLEGVALDPTGRFLLAVKEAENEVIEIAVEDEKVTNRQRLAEMAGYDAVERYNEENGFRDSEVSADEIDFSDLCYDQLLDRFWIISDKAKRIYLFDRGKNEVIQSATLGYGKDGEYREIEKAEGVAIDPEANRLYVVSDEEARLYVFDIRG